MFTWSSLKLTGDELRDMFTKLQIPLNDKIALDTHYNAERKEYDYVLHKEYSGLTSTHFGFTLNLFNIVTSGGGKVIFAYSPQMPQRLYANYKEKGVYFIQHNSDILVNIGNAVFGEVIVQAAKELTYQEIAKNDLSLSWESGLGSDRDIYRAYVLDIDFKVIPSYISSYDFRDRRVDYYYLSSDKLRGVISKETHLGTSLDKDVFLRRAEKEILKVLSNPLPLTPNVKESSPNPVLKLKWEISKDIPYDLSATSRIVFKTHSIKPHDCYVYLKADNSYFGDCEFAWYAKLLIGNGEYLDIPITPETNLRGTRCYEKDPPSFLDILALSENNIARDLKAYLSRKSKIDTSINKALGVLS